MPGRGNRGAADRHPRGMRRARPALVAQPRDVNPAATLAQQAFFTQVAGTEDKEVSEEGFALGWGARPGASCVVCNVFRPRETGPWRWRRLLYSPSKWKRSGNHATRHAGRDVRLRKSGQILIHSVEPARNHQISRIRRQATTLQVYRMRCKCTLKPLTHDPEHCEAFLIYLRITLL